MLLVRLKNGDRLTLVVAQQFNSFWRREEGSQV